MMVAHSFVVYSITLNVKRMYQYSGNTGIVSNSRVLIFCPIGNEIEIIIGYGDVDVEVHLMGFVDL